MAKLIPQSRDSHVAGAAPLPTWPKSANFLDAATRVRDDAKDPEASARFNLSLLYRRGHPPAAVEPTPPAPAHPTGNA